jgi:hypothetical protein
VLVGFVFGNTAIDPRPNALGEYPSTRSATGIALANPLEVIDRFRYTQATNRFVGSARLDIAPFEGFSADATFGYDTYTQNGTISIPPGNTSFDFRNGFQRFATQSVRQVNVDVNARYFRELSDWLKSTTLIGGTLQYDETDILGAQTINTTPNVEIVGGGVPQLQARRAMWCVPFTAPSFSKPLGYTTASFSQVRFAWMPLRCLVRMNAFSFPKSQCLICAL